MPKGEEELLMLMPKSNYEFLRGWALMTHEDSGIGLFHSCLMGEPVKRFNGADLRAILAFVERHRCSPPPNRTNEQE